MTVKEKMLFHCGKVIETDAQGYLLNPEDWSEQLAVKIAQLENIELTKAHWEIIHFIRAFYIEYQTSPAIRTLTKAIAYKLGEEQANSRYLYKLFPKGPAKIATKIAGLPKPVRCI